MAAAATDRLLTMSLIKHLAIIMASISIVIGQKDNVELSCSNDEKIINYCPDTYYYFYCSVTKSSLLVWKVSGTQVAIISSNNLASDDFPKEYNILFDIDLGAFETETNFTSSMQFKPADFDAESVTCESAESSSTITLIQSGDISEPTNVRVNATYHLMKNETILTCEWSYDGNIEELVLFHTEIEGEESELYHDIHPKTQRNVIEIFQLELSGEYEIRVIAVDHCNYNKTGTGHFSVSAQSTSICPTVSAQPSSELKKDTTGLILLIVLAILLFLTAIAIIIMGIIIIYQYHTIKKSTTKEGRNII